MDIRNASIALKHVEKINNALEELEIYLLEEMLDAATELKKLGALDDEKRGILNSKGLSLSNSHPLKKRIEALLA